MIQFEECHNNINIIDEIFKRQAFHKSTYDVLTHAMDCGAYIAGGFAYKYCQLQIGHNDEDISLFQYLRGFEKPVYVENNNRFLKTGDIDVWFPSEDSIVKFKEFYPKLLELHNPVIRPTKANFGEEIICFNRHDRVGQTVQVITKVFGSPNDVLSTFDIYNAACYIKGDKYYLPEGWRWLNDNKCLHVQNTETPYIVSRIVKWFNKHHFKKLTAQSIEVVNSGIKKFFANREMTDDFAKVKSVINKITPLMENITSENLLLIATCFEADAYEISGATFAKSELNKRLQKSINISEFTQSVA